MLAVTRNDIELPTPMAPRDPIYENRDATVWHVVEDDGSQHCETKVGIQKIFRHESEACAISHVQMWEGDARHDRLHQENPRGRR